MQGFSLVNFGCSQFFRDIKIIIQLHMLKDYFFRYVSAPVFPVNMFSKAVFKIHTVIFFFLAGTCHCCVTRLSSTTCTSSYKATVGQM